MNSRVQADLSRQDGVISRRQVLEAGWAPSDIARLVRRKEWSSVHAGVYVSHTGHLSWRQRAWAAVLYSWPSALCHGSALRAAEGSGIGGTEAATIHVAVGSPRHLLAPAGVRVHRMKDFESRTRWNLGPPRIRYEHAVLDVAGAESSRLRAIARLADACGARRTTPRRLLDALAERPGLHRRGWMTDVLGDVAAGTCSVLEHGYLTRVEQPHGLPTGARQVSHRHDGATVFRDVEYAEVGLVVELDGRLFHTSAEARDADMDRDLEAAVTGHETLRVSYGQVHDRGCETARLIGTILVRRGWDGDVHRCPRCG